MRARLKSWAAALLYASSFTLNPTGPVLALDLSGTAWEDAARPYGLDPQLLYAVAIMESGQARAGGLAPWPWTLWIPKQGGQFFASEAEAQAALAAHREAAVDVGLMQVNLRWHGHRVEQPLELLEPVRNLEVGAAILAEAVASAPADAELGIGRYHSAETPRARVYGRTVLQIQASLAKLGREGAVP